MGIKLAFNFCYLIRFTIISGVHRAFHFPLTCMCKALELKKIVLPQCLESFDTGIMKKLRKFQYWAKNNFVIK